MEELLKIGAAYIRVSDERQDEYSPDSQLKKIREYAAKIGYIIPEECVYYDDGISGKSTKNRDSFNQMIAAAKDKDRQFDAIFVWKFSRFARNQEESMVYKNLLRKKGVSVVSVSEQIPEGHFGSLIERIIEWTDEYYVVNLGVEVSRGMAEKFSRGEPGVPPPFGYRMHNKCYVPYEEEAEIVREIFQRTADGEGQRTIAASLAERGIRTKRGNPPENRWVEYILRNPCYIGKLRRSKDWKKMSQARKFDEEYVMITDGHHEPIISMELWDKVQDILDKQKKMYTKNAKRQQPIQYMLKGLARCSSCGGTLAMSAAVSGKAKTRTMQCCNYSKGSCNTSHSVTVPKIESSFIAGLKEALGEKMFTMTPKKTKRSEQPQVDFDKLIAVEERKLARAKEAYLAEIDTIEQYKQNKKDITDRINELKERRDKEVVKDIDIDAYAKKVAGVVKFIERDDVAVEAKNEALRTIIEKIVYDKAKGELAIYFHDF